ncbi:hypothetical protein ES703_28369 [subsurface metagenome]
MSGTTSKPRNANLSTSLALISISSKESRSCSHIVFIRGVPLIGSMLLSMPILLLSPPAIIIAVACVCKIHLPSISFILSMSKSKLLASEMTILSAYFFTCWAELFHVFKSRFLTIRKRPGSTTWRSEFDSQIETASGPITSSRAVAPAGRCSLRTRSQKTRLAPAARSLAVSLSELLSVSSVMQYTPSSEEQTPQPCPPRGHCPFFSFMVVTFIPVILPLLLNFLISAHASSVLPTLVDADPIINIASSLIILSLKATGGGP